ncbi:MAG: serine hydrolase, partial [Saprospiraceae bacterium]|nr:serine hydrolase [Saprospiraceae bacterium]
MSPKNLFLLFVLLIASCRQPSPDTSSYSVSEEIEKRLIDAINYEIDTKDLNAISMVLVNDQEIIWNKGFGFKDEEKSIPVDGKTVYRVGSVSKLFTDIAIMQKVESGEIDLDAPITEYLPDFKLDNSFNIPITLRMLTSHRSGILREPRVGNYFDAENDDLKKTYESIINTRVIYEPGSKTKYSNAGIAIVGYVMQHLAGKPYAQYMKDNVLQVIGMDDSGFEPSTEIKSNLAEATMWSYDERTFTAPTFQLGMAPAGSLYAPMGDLGKFLMTLFDGGEGENGRLLSRDRIREMWTPQFGGEANDGYGIGFRLGDFQGHQKVGHGGAIYGFSTQLYGVPELKLGVACASSVDVTNSVTSRLSNYALDLMYAEKQGMELPEYEKTTPIPMEKQMQLAGYYESENSALEIFSKSGKLVLSTETVEISLRQGKDGIVSDGRLNYGGLELKEKEGEVYINDRLFKKVDPPSSSEYPEDWSNLIGEYGEDHSVLYFYEDNGSLFALIEWTEKDKLTQLSENEFAFPESRGMYHGEKLVFKRDDQGNVISVEIENGPVFNKRDVGATTSETFRIKPVKPIEELRADALAESPPEEEGDFKDSDLVELKSLDPSIKYDIRYATTNNFMSNTFYTLPRAYMQRPAAEAVVRVHQKLKEKGYGLLIHDAYRPW